MNVSKRIKLENDVLQAIGYASLEKNDIDYEKTHKFLNKIKISNIVVIKHFWSKRLDVHLTLKRPGLFIGKRGETFDYVMGYLEDKFECEIGIYLKECKIDDYLYPSDYMLMFNEDDCIEEYEEDFGVAYIDEVD